MTTRGDISKFRQLLREHGYTVVIGHSGHWKIYDGDRLVTTGSCSPSDVNALRNMRNDIRLWELAGRR